MRGVQTSNTITIHAPQQVVWRALTTTDLIKEWFFGVDTETDWRVGSPLVHRGTWQGKQYEDKGTIIQFDPPGRLVHTHWSPLSGQTDDPENYQHVTWALAERNGDTKLTITEVNLPSEEAKRVSDQAWLAVLGNLKQLLEGREPFRESA